jgi:hypothetical protein
MRAIMVGPLSSTTRSKASNRPATHRVAARPWELHDVVGGIAQSHEPEPSLQQDGIIERTGPGGSGLGSCDQLSTFRNVLRAQLAFFSPLRLPHFQVRLFCFSELLTEFVQFGDSNKEIGLITGEN